MLSNITQRAGLSTVGITLISVRLHSASGSVDLDSSQLNHKISQESIWIWYNKCISITIRYRPNYLMWLLYKNPAYFEYFLNRTGKFKGWWKQYTPLKRRCTSTRLHGAISQKALSFINATAVRTWNLTCLRYLISWLESLVGSDTLSRWILRWFLKEDYGYHMYFQSLTRLQLVIIYACGWM
jgi:hypothetical protein